MPSVSEVPVLMKMALVCPQVPGTVQVPPAFSGGAPALLCVTRDVGQVEGAAGDNVPAEVAKVVGGEGACLDVTAAVI